MDAVHWHQGQRTSETFLGRGSSKTNTLRGCREEGTWAEEPGKHKKMNTQWHGISMETCKRGSKEQAIRLTASGHNPTYDELMRFL